MLDALFWVVVGMFIGWHFPQPAWVELIVNQIKAKFGKAKYD